MIRVKLEGDERLIRKLEALGVRMSDVLAAAAQAGAEVVRVAAEARAPGPHILSEVTERMRTRATAAVGPDKEHWYYRFFETGAGPHAIEGSPMLVFQGASGTVFARQVQHPGMAAKPFLRPAMDENTEKAQDEMGEVFHAAVMREAE